MLPSPAELSYFIEIAHTHNISRAAERLGISQPSLSLAMKRLEQNIGTQLLIRQKNGIQLTQAGKQLLQHAKELLQLWEKTQSRALASEIQVQGRVSVGCASVIADYLLSTTLPKILKTHPKLEVDIHNDISRKITEQVINLSIDIGIVVNPVKHPDLILKKCFTDEFTCWHRGEIDDDSVIICEPSLQQSQILLKSLRQNGYNNRTIHVDSLETVAHMTANGAGIGLLPARVATFMYPKKLKRLQGAGRHSDTIYLVYRTENKRILAVRTLIDAMSELASRF